MRKIKQLPLLVLALLLIGSAAAAQEKTAGIEAQQPIVVYKSEFPINLDGGEYTMINMVIDFPNGAGFSKHYHGGYALVTVLSGELTLEREDGSRLLVKTGEKWTENPGEVHAVMNRGMSARVTATMLLPKGADLTTFIK